MLVSVVALLVSLGPVSSAVPDEPEVVSSSSALPSSRHATQSASDHIQRHRPAEPKIMGAHASTRGKQADRLRTPTTSGMPAGREPRTLLRVRSSSDGARASALALVLSSACFTGSDAAGLPC